MLTSVKFILMLALVRVSVHFDVSISVSVSVHFDVSISATLALLSNLLSLFESH